jgi:hypothetical protein
MTIKGRIKKLEQHPGIEQKRNLVILSLVNTYTPEELEAYKETIDWGNTLVRIIFWDGERFTDEGGSETPADRQLEIQLSDKNTMELMKELIMGVDPHREVTP